MFFLRKGRRAQRAENFDAISYTLKKYIRLLRSELETKSYTLKTVYGNYRVGSTLKSINYIALLLLNRGTGREGGWQGRGRKKPGPKCGTKPGTAGLPAPYVALRFWWP